MGMSTNVKGFKPPGEKWQQMKAVYDACMAANIEVPGEVSGYFENGTPDPSGVEVRELTAAGALHDWKDDNRDGFEIDVTKLPADVTVIRFYNSW